MALVPTDIADIKTFVFKQDDAAASDEGIMTGEILAPIDVVTGRVYSSSATVTRHPVESGSAVSDHIIDEPDTIELTGIITNTPAHALNTIAAAETRAEDYWGELLAVRRAKELVTIVSGPYVLEDMVVRELTRADDAQSGEAVKFQMRAEQITQVESASVDAPTRDDGTQKKKKATGKKPAKEATPAQESSFALKGLEWLT